MRPHKQHSGKAHDTLKLGEKLMPCLNTIY